jgi:hypothetical protein
VFPAQKLKEAVPPPKVLKPEDFENMHRGQGGYGRGGGNQWRPTIGMTQSSPRASLDSAARRMLDHSLHNQSQRTGHFQQNHSNYHQGQGQGQRYQSFSHTPAPTTGSWRSQSSNGGWSQNQQNPRQPFYGRGGGSQSGGYQPRPHAPNSSDPWGRRNRN